MAGSVCFPSAPSFVLFSFELLVLTMLTEKFFLVILGPTVVTFRCDELSFVFDSVALFFYSYRYSAPSHDFYLQLFLFTILLFTKFYSKDKISDNKCNNKKQRSYSFLRFIKILLIRDPNRIGSISI